MPSRNIEKIYLPDSYYHVYNRGVNKRTIFKDEEDYAVFLNLCKRYLSVQPVKDTRGRAYPWLYDQLELLSFCLMPNHFHILIFQKDEFATKKLLHGICTAYTRYFNEKYHRVGPLFQSRFKASLITNDAYLQHISRYIHLNPRDYMSWRHSSLPHYMRGYEVEWVRPRRILELFPSRKKYIEFLSDYTDYKETLCKIETELAHK